MSEIKAELSTTSNSLITYGDIIGIFSPTQVKMSDFYGKTHCVTVQVVNNVFGSTDSIRINDCDNDSYTVLPANYPSNYTLCVNYNRRIPDSVGGDATITLVGTECFTTTPTAPSPAAPSPAAPSPPSPAAPPVYYYNATRCDNYTNYIIYGGTNYYGTGTVVISGGTTYCYTIQNEVGVQAYVDTVGASVIDCNDAACYVPPPPSPTPTPPYSYLLNNGGEATGPDACNEYNSSITATYYSNQSSITTGTTLYLSDYVTVVPDGYYSDGTNYWYFVGGATSDLGTSC